MDDLAKFVAYWTPMAQLLGFVNIVVVTVILAYGMQQVRWTKKGIRLRNERAAKEKAIEYASRWLSSYVPLETVYGRARAGAGIPPYQGPIGEFTLESIPAEWRAHAENCRTLPWLAAMNELLAIAAAYSTGVADERTGFQIIGRAFVAVVERHYDMLSYNRDMPAHPYFQPIVDLYKIWRPRLSKAELELARKELEAQIALIPDPGTPPVGATD